MPKLYWDSIEKGEQVGDGAEVAERTGGGVRQHGAAKARLGRSLLVGAHGVGDLERIDEALDQPALHHNRLGRAGTEMRFLLHRYPPGPRPDR